MKTRILIVDNSSTSSKMFHCILEDNGFEVSVAYDVLSAFDLLKENQPDIILLDMMRSEMNGFEFLTQLKVNKITAPVIIVSTEDDDKIRSKAFDLGAYEYIIKPVNFKELTLKINRVLSYINSNSNLLAVQAVNYKLI